MDLISSAPPLVFPVDSAREILNIPWSLQLGFDGSLHVHGPVSSLGAIKTHVTDQFINGTSQCGYIRVTLDATGIGSGVALATLILPIAPVWFPNILLSPIRTSNPMYYDSIAVAGHTDVVLSAQGAIDTESQAFDIVSTGSVPGSQSYAFLYQVFVK